MVLHPMLGAPAAHTTPRDVDQLFVGFQDRQSQLSRCGFVAEHVCRPHLQVSGSSTSAGPAVVPVEALPQVGRHVDATPHAHPAVCPQQPIDVSAGHPGVQRLPTRDESALRLDDPGKVRVSVVPIHVAESRPNALPFSIEDHRLWKPLTRRPDVDSDGAPGARVARL
jgi:hypothetical protein